MINLHLQISALYLEYETALQALRACAARQDFSVQGDIDYAAAAQRVHDIRSAIYKLETEETHNAN